MNMFFDLLYKKNLGCEYLNRLNMIPYDVQLLGAIILHKGKVAEMKTGEGKTLVATMPIYLNALTGRGVHVITVNDYLAQRDAEWIGEVYKRLSLTVGYILKSMDNKNLLSCYPLSLRCDKQLDLIFYKPLPSILHLFDKDNN